MWTDIKSNREVMAEFIKKEKPKVIAEIGVWKSRLVKSLLRSCGDIITQYWAIDSWQPFNYDNEFEPDMDRYVKTTSDGWENAYLYACKLMYYFPQLHIIKTSSIKASKLFPLDFFDLVFIDADHRYRGILSDIKTWLPLIRKNGFLSGHDYKHSHPGVIKAVNETFFSEDVKIVKDSSVWITRI